MVNISPYLIGTLSIIITFGLAVFVHEFGHMFFALVRGVGVESFAIGMGPKIVAWHWKGIEFSLRWFPIGGFVKLKGIIKAEPPVTPPQKLADANESPAAGATAVGTDEPGGVLTLHDVKVDDGQDKHDKSLTESSYDDLLALADKGFVTKLLVFGGGVFMNFVTAIVAMALALYLPHEEPRFKALIEKVTLNSKPAQAGLLAGDQIVAVNGQPIVYVDEMIDVLGKEAELKAIDLATQTLPVTFTVSRGAIQETVKLNEFSSKTFQDDVEILKPALIGDVAPHLPADKAGLKPGDRIISVNDQAVKSFTDMAEIIKANLAKPIKIVAQRGNQQLTFTVTPVENFEDFKKGQIGISNGSEVIHKVREVPNLLRAITLAPKATAMQMGMLVTKQWDFFRRANFKIIKDNLGGPIAIADLTQRKAREGFSKSLEWFINLNLLLMIFNLLPIPVLDGGFILLAAIEGIARRPVSPKILQPIYTLFVIFFISLMLLISLLDIKRFFL